MKKTKAEGNYADSVQWRNTLQVMPDTYVYISIQSILP